MPEFYADTCPHCGDKHPTAVSTLPDGLPSKITREIARIVADVYNGNVGKENIDYRLLKLVGNAVESAMIDGFGKSFATVDWTTPDGEMLMRLTRDCWNFSAAKNYTQLRDMTLALVDEKGKARTFSEFKDACKVIDEKHLNWLKTEYDQAIGASTMAARWADYQKNADIMPWLKYSTVGDQNVREEHALLDGIIKKITDEFWDIYFPPNGWKCRCSADQMSTSLSRETENVPSVTIPDMFRTNLAKTGLAFPPKHPYYDIIPKEILRGVPFRLPEKEAFKELYRNENTGGYVRMHIMHGLSEYQENYTTAKILADRGDKIKLLPILKTDEERKLFYGNQPFISGKNPDCFLNGALYEIKSIENATRKKLQKKLMEGREQAANVIMHLTNGADDNLVYRAINGIFNQSKHVNNVIIINNLDYKIMKNPNYVSN